MFRGGKSRQALDKLAEHNRGATQHRVPPTLRQAQGPRVGGTAFPSRLRGLKLVPLKSRYLIRPPASNADRWAENKILFAFSNTQ